MTNGRDGGLGISKHVRFGLEGEPVETWIRVNRPFVRSSVGGLEIETASMQDGKKV